MTVLVRYRVVSWLVLVVATAGWQVALSRTRVGALGQWGLVPAFPLLWYVSLVLVLDVVLLAILTRPASEYLAFTSITLFTWMLYGSPAFLEKVPRLDYVYKHIAVTNYIGGHGSVDASIDIYNRWPGFFALSAFIGKVIGRPDAVSYAAWAEPVFATVDVLLVVAIARVFSRNPRFYWAAGLLFALTNWIGQNYYSPQAFAFALYLVICLVVVTVLRSPAPRRFGLWVEKWVARLVRVPRPTDPTAAPVTFQSDVASTAPPRANRRIALALVVVLAAIIVVSHQLTPYVLLLVVLPLLLAGYLRPLWLGVVLLVLTIGYLVPNLAYIQKHFGLFSGLDPFANATYTATAAQPTVIPAETWQTRGTLVLSLAAVLLLLVGLVRRARAGDVRSAVFVAWFAFAPLLLLSVQSYGGEGRLRALLFALPWVGVAGMWSFWPRTGASPAASPGQAPEQASVSRLRTTYTFVSVMIALAAVFVPSYFQPEFENQVAAADIAAAKWLDGHVHRGDIVLTTDPITPVLVGPHYNDIVDSTAAVTDFAINGKPVGASGLQTALATMRQRTGAQRAFVIVTTAEQRYSAEHGLYRPGALRQIESGLATSSESTLVYDRAGARIYQISQG